MPSSHKKCCVNNYVQFRFEDSLRKYEPGPRKKLKCQFEKCQQCIKRNHNLTYQQRINKLASARKSYGRSNQRHFNTSRSRQLTPIKFNYVSEFNNQLSFRYSPFKEILVIKTIRLPSLIKQLQQKQDSISKSFNNQQINQQYNDAQLQYQNNSPFKSIELNDIKQKCIQQQQDPIKQVQRESALFWKQMHKQYEFRSQNNEDQYGTIEQEHNTYLSTQNYIQEELLQQKVQQFKIKIEDEQSNSKQIFKEQCTFQSNKQSYEIEDQQERKNYQPINSLQDSQRKIKRNFVQIPLTIKSGHLRIKNGIKQCLLSVRVFNKYIKPLQSLDDMAETIIKQRPYLELYKQSLKDAISSHLKLN